jgi:hypothetical protein
MKLSFTKTKKKINSQHYYQFANCPTSYKKSAKRVKNCLSFHLKGCFIYPRDASCIINSSSSIFTVQNCVAKKQKDSKKAKMTVDMANMFFCACLTRCFLTANDAPSTMMNPEEKLMNT